MKNLFDVSGKVAVVTGGSRGIGAMIARAKIMNWEAGSHASTFGGNPLSCQAAMATIELLENNMMKNAEKQGNRLLEGLKKLQKTLFKISYDMLLETDFSMLICIKVIFL